MKAVLLLSFQLSLASLVLGDFLPTQSGLPASRIASIEVDFTGPLWRWTGCGSSDVWLKLSKHYGNERRSCSVGLGHPGHGENVRRNRYDQRINDCSLTFDDGNSLPRFQIFSRVNDKFCLAHIKVRTENGQSFYYDFNGFFESQTHADIPLISERSLSASAHQIANLNCPTSGCPLADVFVYDTQIPHDYYCSVNLNCNFVTSTGLRDSDNGFVCTESVGSYGLPKYCCQSGEHQGIEHCDNVVPRNNPPPNNRTTETGLRLGPFGTGPSINGHPLVGTPFTATGPFAKISIKTMPFGNYPATAIVKGIKTESNDGRVQTFGMHEYDTADVSELIVPQGEHISGVKLSYELFIAQLGFVTNTYHQLGPVGRRTVSRSEAVPRNIDPGRTLISIEGDLVNFESTKIMTRLKFTFAEPNQRGSGQNGGGQRGGRQSGGRQSGGGQRRGGQNGGQNWNGYHYHQQ